MIKAIEIELTSACNARCPICMRTRLIEKGIPVKTEHYTIEDIKQYFGPIDMKDRRVKFCGVLGDPIACPDLYEISEYFLDKQVKHIEVSTNAGLKTTKFWEEYGELSERSNNRLEIHFAIDGVYTNDYRVGVNLDKVWNNVDTYLNAGGFASWQFIIFDYNKDEVPIARTMARDKGMKFITRTAWKNDASAAEQEEVRRKTKNRDYA
ncbi:MAG: hypothetical protein CMJ90_17690 [Planctomycetes bacterium]|nr:hypothetical protein [Planctomycetota bacterium]|tara:strand:- start:1367 stop:1990 length:624 start_codon:yes stop_codon:yes gene_type:complete